MFQQQSLTRLHKSGIAIPITLPLLDEFVFRPISEMLDRILCLNAAAAVAHRHNRAIGKLSELRW